jgi:hypothetical protein
MSGSVKRLVELNPRWVGAGGEDVRNADGSPAPRREGVAVSFDCPCGCADRCFIPLTTGLDGEPFDSRGWDRTGETFETLTLTPSIQRVGGCAWHGWLRDGSLIEC